LGSASCPLGFLWEVALTEERVERRLAAILVADVAGYSQLMGRNEVGTVTRLRAHRRDVIDPNIAVHEGRIVRISGDGMLIEFTSVVQAVSCALAFQRGMEIRNAGIQNEDRIEFRIGINSGDVIVEKDDIHGDGINIAARLEALAEPGGIFVSQIIYEQVRGKVDCAFDYVGEHRLKNIALPVRVYRARVDSEPGPSVALPLPDKPSVAVLPFANMSGDPEQEYFADGLVEEIITALSRIRWLFVIARNSSFAYKGQAVDMKRVGRELGVRYVLQGSIRKSRDRVRITVQLIEAETGTHLWADHFDAALENVFDLQDQVANNVAGIIEPTLKTAEIHRSAARHTDDLTAYDLYLRALQHTRSLNREGYSQALEFLKEAIRRDPQYGPALSLASFSIHCLHVSGWTADPEHASRQGIDFARRALRAAEGDAETLSCAAHVLGYFGEDIDASIALIGHSVQLNPSFAPGWYWSGWLRLWAGQANLAIKDFETALRLNPRDPHPSSLLGVALSHFFAWRFEEAKVLLVRALQQLPGWAPPYRFLAACCTHLGQHEEARERVRQLRILTPLVVPSATHWRNAEDRELYLSALRLAAGETP
jgi:adenylate cyclase